MKFRGWMLVLVGLFVVVAIGAGIFWQSMRLHNAPDGFAGVPLGAPIAAAEELGLTPWENHLPYPETIKIYELKSGKAKFNGEMAEVLFSFFKGKLVSIDFSYESCPDNLRNNFEKIYGSGYKEENSDNFYAYVWSNSKLKIGFSHPKEGVSGKCDARIIDAVVLDEFRKTIIESMDKYYKAHNENK